MYKCKYPHLFSSVKVGNTIFRNRIFASPTGLQYALAGNRPTAEGIAYYERKAVGGAASVCIGDAMVDSQIALANGSHILLDDPGARPSLTKLADAITKHGAVASMELSHGGNAARISYNQGHTIYGPSKCHAEGFNGKGTEAEEMTREIMDYTTKKFVDAALFVKQCGFGMITIHGGHGWLLHQFMSPAVNHRTDEYGGSFENCMRYPLEVLRAVRDAVGPDFPIEIRISGSEVYEGGYGIDYGVKIAEAIDDLVDIIHVSAGSHENADVFTVTHPSMFLEDGVNVKYAAEIKKHVHHALVATVGALSDPAQLEEIIASGKADIVELARGLICDPDLPLKARQGKGEDVRKCIRCFTCFSNLMVNGHIICALNPEISHESEEKYAYPPVKKKKVLIAGGGIAGMQAALCAKRAGHEVTLCEKSDKLGGVLLCERNVPFKAHLHEYLEQQAEFIKRENINVMLNTEVTPEFASILEPDVIIAAVGASPLIPKIPGIDGENVYTAEEIYVEPYKATGKTVILGGGLVGTELAIFLAMQGHDVEIVEMANRLNCGSNILQGQSIGIELRKYNIPVHLGTKVKEIRKDGIVCLSGGEEIILNADTAVCAFGMKANDKAADALRFIAPEFHQIGDCLSAKTIAEATKMAWYAVKDIGKI